MSTRMVIAALTALVAVVGWLAGGGLDDLRAAAKADEPDAPAGRGAVVKVVDGDTLWVETGNVDITVRVLGINTPETVAPNKPVECGGAEASAAAKKLLTGQTVRLATDPTQDQRDRYDRLLAYVTFTSGPNKGRDFGALMVRAGHAREYTYSAAHKRQDRYRTLEKQAREQRRGLWGTCPA